MPPTPIYTPDPANLLLGKGENYFNRFDANGQPTGWRHLGNSHSTEIQNADEIIKSYSGMDSEAGVYKQDVKRREPILNINFEEIVPENVALLVMGDVDVEENTTNTPVVDEELGAVIANRWYRLAGRNVTSVSVSFGSTENASAAGPATEDDDYTVDEATGRIYIMPGGAIEDGDFVFASYTPGDYSHYIVKAGTQGAIEGAFHFIPDPTAGPSIEAEIWRATVSPDGVLGLISEEYAQATLKATIMKDRVFHPTEPYFKLRYL